MHSTRFCRGCGSRGCQTKKPRFASKPQADITVKTAEHPCQVAKFANDSLYSRAGRSHFEFPVGTTSQVRPNLNIRQGQAPGRIASEEC